MARSNPPMSTRLRVRALAGVCKGTGRRWRCRSPGSSSACPNRHLTIEQLVQSGTQQQAADQVSISNSIGSLRFLAAMDWREFVESMSVVEQQAARGPGGHLRPHGLRHARPLPARRRAAREAQPRCRKPRSRARRSSLRTKRAPRPGSADARAAHVGFYLIDAGRTLLERAAQACRAARMAALRHPRVARCLGRLLRRRSWRSPALSLRA